MSKGYTHCHCCGLDSIDDDLCAYCEDHKCAPDEHGDYWECNFHDKPSTAQRICTTTPHDELDHYVEG